MMTFIFFAFVFASGQLVRLAAEEGDGQAWAAIVALSLIGAFIFK